MRFRSSKFGGVATINISLQITKRRNMSFSDRLNGNAPGSAVTCRVNFKMIRIKDACLIFWTRWVRSLKLTCLILSVVQITKRSI